MQTSNTILPVPLEEKQSHAVPSKGLNSGGEHVGYASALDSEEHTVAFANDPELNPSTQPQAQARLSGVAKRAPLGAVQPNKCVP